MNLRGIAFFKYYYFIFRFYSCNPNQFLVDLIISTWSTPDDFNLYCLLIQKNWKLQYVVLTFSWRHPVMLNSINYSPLFQLRFYNHQLFKHICKGKNVGQSLYYTLCNIILLFSSVLEDHFIQHIHHSYGNFKF